MGHEFHVYFGRLLSKKVQLKPPGVILSSFSDSTDQFDHFGVFSAQNRVILVFYDYLKYNNNYIIENNVN